MRSGFSTLALAAMAVLALPGLPASAQPYSERHSGAEVDVDIFYDSLAPYGEWIETPEYGWSWAPRVERRWRPYTRGQWVMTDYGWFWDSDERFGWATYHYGRWVNDRYYGWLWIPGTEWAPAWVSWRHGNGYTGWAPLPPRATWQTRIGLTIGGLDIDAFIGARDYAFVRDRAFVDRGVYQRVLPPTQNVTIINVTTNVTNYTVLDDRVVNSGIAVATFERAAGRRVVRAHTVDVHRADAAKRTRADEVPVFRPEVRAAPGRRPVHGRSLVKGDEPPPLLLQRRRERERDRQSEGGGPEATARDVEQQRPTGPTRDKKQEAAEQRRMPRSDAPVLREQAQRPPDRTRQEADEQRTRDRDQQRLDQEKRQAIGQQQRDQARQEADKQRTKDRDAQRLDQEKRQAIGQQQRDQARQEADKQRTKHERVEKRDGDTQAQTGKRVKDGPQEDKDKGKKNPKDKGEKSPEDKGKKDPQVSPAPPGPQQ